MDDLGNHDVQDGGITSLDVKEYLTKARFAAALATVAVVAAGCAGQVTAAALL